MLGQSLRLKWLYGIGIFFLILNAIALYLEQFWVLAIPAALIIAWLFVFRLDIIYFIVVFATPLSMNLEDLEFAGLGVYLPTEPLLAAMVLVLLIRGLKGHAIDRKVLRHPVTIAIAINLVWILITSVTSSNPVVSFKFLLSRLWFVVPCYLFAIQIFRRPENMRYFLWTYIVPLMGVIVYTLINHTIFAFDEKAAHWVMSPFFKDHTSYGAILAMFIPVVVALLLQARMSIQWRYAMLAVTALFGLALVLSYTRAAWISLLGALAVFVVLHYQVKTRVIAFGVLILGVAFFSLQNDIIRAIEKNKQDSSDDLVEHVQSISNVTSDASNLERLNRWNAAYGMFKERPLVGWGPGTYAFEYAPFQSFRDLTIISTNFGDKGNAHSEYFGPAAESGVLGSLTFIGIVIAIIWTAVRVYKRYRGRKEYYFLLPAFLGLVTYFLHGMLNNYLDTDKASIPFWGFTAMLVAADVFGRKKLEEPAAK